LPSAERAAKAALVVVLIATCAPAGCSSRSATDAQTGSAVTDSSTDSSNDATSIITASLCAQMCGVVLQVTCPVQATPDGCLSSCLAQADLCSTQGAAYYQCIIEGGPSTLTCDPVQHFTVLKAGSCSKPRDDLGACLSGK
jgi:hypothetical protein